MTNAMTAMASTALPFPGPISTPTPALLKLPNQQIRPHLPRRHPRRPPQRIEIKRAEKRIRIPKEQHRRDPAPRVLERKAPALGHHVLLDLSAAQVVHRALGIDLGLVVARARRVRQLVPGQDMEVVVGCVPARVALGADGGAEDDEVLGYACGGLGGVLG